MVPGWGAREVALSRALKLDIRKERLRTGWGASGLLVGTALLEKGEVGEGRSVCSQKPAGARGPGDERWREAAKTRVSAPGSPCHRAELPGWEALTG